MKQEDFQLEYKKMVKSASLDEINSLFNQQKKLHIRNNFLKIHFMQIKNYFSKDSNTILDSLGVSKWNQVNVTFDWITHALNAERKDIIYFLFENKYYDKESLMLYCNRFLETSPIIFKDIVSNKLLRTLIKDEILEDMYEECASRNIEEHLHILLDEYSSPQDKTIDKMLIYAARFNCTDILKSMLSGKHIKQCNINVKYDDKYKEDIDDIDSRENILIHAHKNNNIELIEFLFSNQVKEKIDLAESYNYFISNEKGREFLKYLILELNIDYTENIKKHIDDTCHSHNHIYKEMFEKREFKNSLEFKMPTKNNKVKQPKLKI